MEYKLGKLPAKKDPRTLLVSTILKKVKVPVSYSFDTKHTGIPTPMFGNDEHGDCVIAGRAHQTLRFEREEQKKTIKISDDDVLKEWYKENGGTENGLTVLDSLNSWRKEGWMVGGKNYKIKAFAANDPHDMEEIKTTIYLDIGIGLGLSLPDGWRDELNAGKPWANTYHPPNPYNGHYVYVVGYNSHNLTCLTWGQKQKMSWAFFKKYTDEAYAIIDDKNIKKLDEEKINDFLKDHPLNP